MALFLIPRYTGGGEEGEGNGPGSHSQALLQRLQERVRTRELQKARPKGAVSMKPSRLEGEALRPEDKGGSKEASGKKRQQERDGSPLRKVCRKRRKKKQQEDESLLDTDGGSDREDDETDTKERDCARDKELEKGEERSVPVLSPNTSPPPTPPSLTVLGQCSWKPVQKVKPLLPPWLNEPQLLQRRIKENLVPLCQVPEIHPKLVKKLQANGIESLFPVQAEVIPAILASVSRGFLTGRGGYQPSDVCVSAPTGSGKTLAFVIPVVQALLDRVVCQVRALVVLPTKELAQQVSKVFHIYTDGTGLKVAQLTGQKPFAKEQELLVEKTPAGFRSLADIVVATPGRLVDHLQQTAPFSLRQLRFLVIDEADRMIDGMHQNWLEQVAAAVHRPEEGAHHPQLFARTQQAPLTAARASVPQLPFQKLLFSATLTHSAEKLQPLGLFRPRLFAPASSSREEEEVEGLATPKEEEEEEKKYTLPEGLSHYFVPCSLRWKPLFLLHFLLRLKFSRVLCFVNSRETSHRLFLLVKAFGGVSVAEFSSRLTPSQRKGTLKDFERGKIQLLISTDATARGIDIAGVKCVISYDAPQFIRTYVHRVGRTARAGRAGLAFTLLLKQQETKFLRMLREAGLPPLERQLVQSSQIRTLLPGYEESLAALQAAVKEERAEKRS
ncbi:ATP-dependent RNA helicase DDX51 isoform X2 [Sceloporus undulatus]|uniref:ATP-dependent RNA helicase DDX51 isoform X2 n=1 Tax=Sceloporus undulatus TaxID=8520 RepID=UPI001C4CD892|nr:ATP-dependent RNA helicase DDX51 isoform X2 [Sceloporus undulatus]